MSLPLRRFAFASPQETTRDTLSLDRDWWAGELPAQEERRVEEHRRWPGW